MKKRVIIPTVVICSIITAACHTKHHFSTNDIKTNVKTTADSIGEAIDYQILNYPCSQYRDVYKNFMQDFFGPGHILSDTAASGRYLRSELSEEGPFSGPLYEKTGYRGNFYRVNLRLIKEGIIPYDVFFNTFVESVQGITPPSGEEWMKKWGEIDSIISNKKIKFPEGEEDRISLKEQFKRGDYVAHHSQRYNDSVHFHYRIISKDGFESTLLPLIHQKNLHIRE